MPETSILEGPRLRLRLAVPPDLAALTAIRHEPGVRHWWGEILADDFDQPEDGALFAIEVDGVVAGAIQYEEVTDSRYHSAGIDIYLGAAWQGRGLGREAVVLLARHLIDDRGHHRLTIDPATANECAIRCYEAVGFERVGVMRRYERGDDGSWHDNLLMELLAGE
jgi:aminoglycoside 6'-N-acetyltransferase